MREALRAVEQFGLRVVEVQPQDTRGTVRIVTDRGPVVAEVGHRRLDLNRIRTAARQLTKSRSA